MITMSPLRKCKVLAFILLLSAEASYGDKVEEKFFDQALDHSGKTPGTWKQRYLENGEYFKPGGPIFIAYGGSFYGKVSPEAVTKGSMVHLAKEQGAFIIQLEARFYGKSRPTPDLSTENLHKFLTIEDGLEDSVDFIKWLKSQPQFKDSKVVAIGQVYLGSRIVQNMRLHPGLIDIGVVSSTMVETRFEIPEYTKKQFEILKKVNPECLATVHDAAACFEKIIHGETCEGHKLDDLKETFNLCADDDPSNTLDNAALVGEIVKLLGYVVLLDDPTAEYNLHKMCDALGDTSKGATHMDKLAGEIKTILKSQNKPCLEFRFDELEKAIEDITWEQAEKNGFERARIFSRCKFSMHIRTPEGLDLPQSTLDGYKNYHLEFCKRAFGFSEDDVKKGTEMTNEKYGKRQIPDKCTIFITEGNDLIKFLEITTPEEAGKCNAVVDIEDGGILSDEIDAANAGDLQHGRGLKEAQDKIGKTISQWLKTGDCCAPVTK